MTPRPTAARTLAAPVLVGIAPCVMAAVRALHAHWLPIGDNGYFAVRARDVLTADHPLLGAWSSGSQAVGVDVNNLGPLQLDLLYPFVKLAGLGAGTVLAVTLLNAACGALVVVLAHRRAGRAGAWVAAGVTAALSWTLGSELLIEPRQHHALVLPFLACLALAWSLADGDVRVLPVAAFVGSLVAQTHLTFLIPLGAISLVALGALGWQLRRGTLDPPAVGGGRILLVTAAVLGVCWVQTVVEELRPGQGNLTSIVEAAQVETPTYGAAAGTRAVATVVVPGVGWLPPTFEDFEPGSSPHGAGASAAILGALAVGLGALGWAARRRGDRTVLAAIGVTTVALVAAVYGAASSPSGRFGVLASNFRWLWSIGAFTTATLLVGIVRLRPTWPRSQAVLAGFAGVAILVSGWALPASHQGAGPADSRELIEVSRDLLDQVHAFEFDGTVLIDRVGTYFGEPFSYVLFAGLQDQDIPFESKLSQDARRFGSRRAYDGTADATLTMVTGPAAERPRPGSERVAFARWLSSAERQELEELDDAAAGGALLRDEEQRRRKLRHRLEKGTVALWLTPGPPE